MVLFLEISLATSRHADFKQWSGLLSMSLAAIWLHPLRPDAGRQLFASCPPLLHLQADLEG